MPVAFFLALLVLGALLGTAVGAECGNGAPCGCGDQLTGRYQLGADLGPCDGDGLVLRNGASLDCHGHTILGRPGTTEKGRPTLPSAGIILDATVGASVRRCRVVGFDYGIRLSDARDSRVIGSETFRNGNFATHVGYGIHLSRSRGNTVQDCVIHESADEGIHIGNGSDGNLLTDNEAYDNPRENYYILSARRNRLIRNRARGRSTTGLYMKHAVDNRIESNRFDDLPVVVRGRSARNTFADNRFGMGLKFQAYGEGPAEAPVENVVRGGQIDGDSACLEFIGAHHNHIEGVSLERCRGVASRAPVPTINDLVSMDLTGVRLDLSGDASLRVLAPMQIRVRTAAGKPVPGARIGLHDSRGDTYEGSTTNKSGVAFCAVPIYAATATGRTILTPVAISVSAHGYASNRAAMTDPAIKMLTVTLASSGGGFPRSPPASKGTGSARPPRSGTGSTSAHGQR